MTFKWYERDVSDLLPPDWQESLLDIARSMGVDRTLHPISVTSREGSDVTEIAVRAVLGDVLERHAAWFVELYRGDLRSIVERCYGEEVFAAKASRVGVTLNVLASGMRYECHVDSNPVTGLLFVTSHAKGEGGELVVSESQSATCVDEVNSHCVLISPCAGRLLIFDGRLYPHYVRPLLVPNGLRVAAVMNFYTSSVGEASRPVDLDAHLFGSQ